MHSGRTPDGLPSQPVIVSNRLPISLSRGEGSRWTVSPSTGGLVAALAPVLREKEGRWIGWPGTLDLEDIGDILADSDAEIGYELRAVALAEAEVRQFYQGFSNEILWPLFHDLQSRCNFEPEYWNMYQAINQRFAHVVADNTRAGDYVWVHDYHLLLVGRELRALRLENPVGFFLHTPFPCPDIFRKLPWRSQVLSAMLDYDLIGFQTPRDRNNFVRCVETMHSVRGVDTRKRVSVITTTRGETRVGAFPIGIDFREYARQASSATVARVAGSLRDALSARQIILGMDRLDYTKGIPERLTAFRTALERHADLRGRVSLIQVVVPSREGIPEYRGLKSAIEELVGQIEGEFTEPGWVPIHYMYRNLERSELLALYKAADVALITPLKDGMNLIAKEYCAANTTEDGVLILSEFAGAAYQLHRDALLVNPYDIEGVAHAIYRACEMPEAERRLRMRRMRTLIARRDVFWWVNSFLRAHEPESAGPADVLTQAGESSA